LDRFVDLRGGPRSKDMQLVPLFGNTVQPKHPRQPFDRRRNRPRTALKAPNLARGDPVGALIAESSTKLLCAKAEIFSDRPQFLTGQSGLM